MKQNGQTKSEYSSMRRLICRKISAMRTSRLACLVALAACGGGGGDPIAPDGYRSGTRLRARFFVEEGGVRVFSTWYDRELDATCAFAPVEGTWRCVPSHAPSTTFRDDACTDPLVERAADACDPPAPFVSIPAREACGDAFVALFPIGARTAPAVVYDRLGDGTCVAREPSPAAVYYGVQAAIEPGALVAAVEARDDGAGRLALVRLESDDGAVQPVAVHDAELDAPCTFLGVVVDGPDALRCYPDAIDVAFYADSLCSQRLAATDAACVGEAPGFARTVVREGCATIVTTYERGEVSSALDVFVTSGDMCVPGDAAGLAVFDVGAEVPLDALASVARAPGEAAARLRAYELHAEGFTRITRALHDAERGVDCDLLDTADGVRCVPKGIVVDEVTFFADAGCTTPLPVWQETVPQACPPPSPPTVLLQPTAVDACTSHVRVFEIGEPVAMAYTGAPDACTPYTPAEGELLHPLGAEIAPDAFVELVELTE